MEKTSSIALQSPLQETLQSSLISAWPSLLFDSLLLFLLLCAVIYAVRLSRSVNAIHRGKAELAWLFARFAESITKAEGLLEDLKRAALETQERHEQNKEKAKRLESDLTYLIEKGNSLADHLEESMSSGNKNSGKPYSRQPYSAHTHRKRTYNEAQHSEENMLNKVRSEENAQNPGGSSANLPSLQNLR